MSKSSAEMVHETIKVRRPEAQERAKLFFEQFPPMTYLTEIVASKSLDSGVVELTVKRRKAPVDQEE
jgi:DNA polymerase I-like protein with 3'-5' exonuclease and polymerase domains